MLFGDWVESVEFSCSCARREGVAREVPLTQDEFEKWYSEDCPSYLSPVLIHYVLLCVVTCLARALQVPNV